MRNEQNNLLKGYNMLLYFCGSMIMSEPTEECVIDFWTSGILKKLPVSSTNPRFLKAASILRESYTDKDTFRKMLSDDYFILFSEAGLRLAPAHASIYLTDKTTGRNIENEVRVFYKTYGWESRHPDKPADHLGIELLFLTKLIDNYLLLDDDPCSREMNKEICRFIEHNILSWIPKWDKEIQEHANTQCFRGIGTLIYACVEDINGIFSCRSTKS